MTYPAFSRARLLRERLAEPRPLLVAGAHNPLSARLVEEAGFDAVWASGFEISASQAVPDANILSFSENLEVARAIGRTVGIPIIADCDSGFGNAVNVIRTVREYEDAGIAGICIEDNVFPKRCSFYANSPRELVSTEEHAGKIRAAKQAQRDPNTFIIARTEALIAGWGREEALRRARAYADAGADAVMIHSKAKTLDELAETRKFWDRDTPLVIVPTIFPGASAGDCYAAGFKIVIFANHGLRASIRAVQETLAELRRTERIADINHRLVPLEEVYRLVGVAQMNADEKQYLPASGERLRAVIVAAGFEPDLLPLIEERPKAMLPVGGKPVLQRQLETLKECGITDVSVVRGYRKDVVDVKGPRYYDNEEFEQTGELFSLLKAEEELDGRVLLLYSDVLFDAQLLQQVLGAGGEINVAVDRAWARHRDAGTLPARPYEDLVALRKPAVEGYRSLSAEPENRIARIGHELTRAEGDAEFIGMVLLSPKGCQAVRAACAAARERGGDAPYGEAQHLRKAQLTDLLQDLVERGEDVRAVSVTGGWLEIDTPEDYRRACEHFESDGL